MAFLDPYTSTRREFTERALSTPCPESAAPKWRELYTKNQALIRALAYHDAMIPNIDQTFMTPAASKNTVYFAWDFANRTMSYIAQVPPSLQNLNRTQREAWDDTRSRTLTLTTLILDRKPGTLNMMIEMTYPDQPKDHPAMGEEVLRAARALDPDP